MSIRVLTWNLQGRERPDLGAVADVIDDRRPHVVALQEVQRGQARWLADRLGWWAGWWCKHWPVVVPAEGLALLAPSPLTDLRRLHLAAPLRLWSSRRRIAVAGTLAADGGPLRVVGVHLGAGVDDAERARQARRTLELVGRRGCVAGDLNAAPGSPVLGVYAAAGLRDVWAEARPGAAGATNWGRRARHRPPTQRLDYVLASDDLEVEGVELPSHGDADFERYGRLSDHLPLLAELRRR